MKLIIFKIIVFLIFEGIWSASANYSDQFKHLCGQPYLDERIIGGSDAVPGEFPFIARILKNDQQPPEFLCDASLITDLHVLTAAHCYHSLDSSIVISLGDFNVAPNKVSKHSVYYQASKIISASNFITSPTADLAIIILARKVEFTRWIAPICLPYKFSTDSLIGKDVTVIGFGLVNQSPDIDPTILQKVNITVRPIKDCRDMARPPGQICTVNSGKSPCFGDSGGPLFKILKRKEGRRYTQVGIVSYGPADCGTSAIFTDVNFYINWIQGILNQYH